MMCSGTASTSVEHLVVPQRRPGRVVRRAEHDRLGGRGDRRPHRLEIVHRARAQRHRHRGRAGDLHRDRVGLEAAPGVDHLVAGLADGLQQVIEHRHRAGAEGQPVRDPRRAVRSARRSSRRWPCPDSGSSAPPPGRSPPAPRAAAGRDSRCWTACTSTRPGTGWRRLARLVDRDPGDRRPDPDRRSVDSRESLDPHFAARRAEHRRGQSGLARPARSQSMSMSVSTDALSPAQPFVHPIMIAGDLDPEQLDLAPAGGRVLGRVAGPAGRRTAAADRPAGP